MSVRGYLEGRNMAAAFNMLRSNDLIWPYVIGNYFKGKEPPPFDLLYWNSDTTRMPAANHSFYLRNCYLDNRLAEGDDGRSAASSSTSEGQDPDLQPRHPRGPHRPAALGLLRLVVLRRQGDLRPDRLGPYRRRHQPAVAQQVPVLDRRRRRRATSFDAWLTKAKEHPGSWWPHWQDWIEALDDTRVKARRIGGGKYKPIEDAPGSYVRVKA